MNFSCGEKSRMNATVLEPPDDPQFPELPGFHQAGFRASHAVTVMRQVSVVGNELLVPMAFKIGISEVDGLKRMPESAGIAGVMQLRVFDRNG